MIITSPHRSMANARRLFTFSLVLVQLCKCTVDFLLSLIKYASVYSMLVLIIKNSLKMLPVCNGNLVQLRAVHGTTLLRQLDSLFL